MSEYFISRTDAEKDLLSCAAYLAERITSIDGHAEAISAVVPQYIARSNVDLAAELANTVDDPYTRDRLLTAVAEKCAEMDDDEYALQLADAVEEPGLRSQAFERIGRHHAAAGEFDKARDIAAQMFNPDAVMIGIAVKQAESGLGADSLATIEEIEHAGWAVTALAEIATYWLGIGDAEKAVEILERAVDKAGEIEHEEEQARAYIDIGNEFTEAGRNDRAIETFDKAKATAETIDNMHRDGFLSLTAQGFLHAGSLELADRTLDLVADKTQIASCLLAYSRELWRKDDREEALESLEESNAILESQHERETRDHRARFRLFTSIASQFAGFEKGERAIEIAERINNDGGERTNALSQIAAILTLRKEDEQARDAYRSISDDGDRVFALIGMSDSKAKNEDRDGAIQLLNEASHLAESVPQLTMRASAYIEIGKRMAAYDRRESANEAFERAVAVIAQIKDESSRVTALTSLGDATAESGIDMAASASSLLQTILVRGA